MSNITKEDYDKDPSKYVAILINEKTGECRYELAEENEANGQFELWFLINGFVLPHFLARLYDNNFQMNTIWMWVNLAAAVVGMVGLWKAFKNLLRFAENQKREIVQQAIFFLFHTSACMTLFLFQGKYFEMPALIFFETTTTFVMFPFTAVIVGLMLRVFVKNNG